MPDVEEEGFHLLRANSVIQQFSEVVVAGNRIHQLAIVAAAPGECYHSATF